MTGKTVTRIDLAAAVYREIGLSRNESAKLVESVLSIIETSLVNGETVKLSSFGTFTVREKNERVGRNPKTGEEVPITPRKVLTFRASHALKDLVNSSNIESNHSSTDITKTKDFSSEFYAEDIKSNLNNLSEGKESLE
ncbi:MAG: integration host factor subunit alpha [Rhodospirillaceae bacterium]|nr:integration host factor subunit alpha [Rhodospirillaceae bacterium]|tara:strand:+ start:677 stop:1093 length:417 start_codon:yes stop_codon:yes gene_type:complete